MTVLRVLWAAASARRRHGDVATRRRNTGQVAGLQKNAGRPLLVHLGARGGGRPLTAPPAWCQDPLAMCAWSRENNPAPNLATLLQGTASTPAVVIDSSPSPGGRGHGRAPDPTRRPPRTQNGPTRRADTRAGTPRDRIAVQGVAADPSASRAGRASAVRDEPPRCREPRGARPRHRRARHAGPPAREQRGSRSPVAPGSSPPRRALATASPGRVRAAEARILVAGDVRAARVRRGERGDHGCRRRPESGGAGLPQRLDGGDQSGAA